MSNATRKKITYSEGDVVAVPLSDGTLSRGVVARATQKHGAILVYFFGPKLRAMPGLQEARVLQAPAAAMAARVGDLDIITGRWPIIGHITDWDRKQWPMPKFIHPGIPELNWPSFVVSYDDNDPVVELSREKCRDGDVGLGKDGLWGAEFAEIVLAREL